MPAFVAGHDEWERAFNVTGIRSKEYKTPMPAMSVAAIGGTSSHCRHD